MSQALLQDTPASGALTGEAVPQLLWLDVSVGATVDSLLGALIDAGADPSSITATLDCLAPDSLHVEWHRGVRGRVTALTGSITVHGTPPQPCRNLAEAEARLDVTGIPPSTREVALRALRTLVYSKARVEGTEVETTPLNEIGSLTTLGGLLAIAEAVRSLGIIEASCSVVGLGSGVLEADGSDEQVPTPLVAELARGWQVTSGPAGQLCSPVGMAVLRTLCHSVTPLPEMALTRIGVGAGSNVHSVTRAFVGPSPFEQPGSTPPTAEDDHPTEVQQISANTTELDARLWPALMDRLHDAGAVEAWLQPIVDRMGDSAHTITALSPRNLVNDVVDVIISHTPTTSVQITPALQRLELSVIRVPIDVDGTQVGVRLTGRESGTIQQVTADFADVEHLATQLASSHRVALARAMTVAWENGLHPGGDWPSEGAHHG